MKAYHKKGQIQGVISSVIMLIVGISVATLVMIFTGALGGQVFEQVEDDITAITNQTVENHVRAGIISAFEAQEQTGSYLPIIVLAIVITLVLAMIFLFCNL